MHLKNTLLFGFRLQEKRPKHLNVISVTSESLELLLC